MGWGHGLNKRQQKIKESWEEALILLCIPTEEAIMWPDTSRSYHHANKTFLKLLLVGYSVTPSRAVTVRPHHDALLPYKSQRKEANQTWTGAYESMSQYPLSLQELIILGNYYSDRKVTQGEIFIHVKIYYSYKICVFFLNHSMMIFSFLFAYRSYTCAAYTI